jgi:hypothetical protein
MSSQFLTGCADAGNMTQLAAVILTVWIEAWMPWRRPGAFAKDVHRLKTPSCGGNYGRRGDSGNASSKGRSPIEKITAPDDSAFMSL